MGRDNNNNEDQDINKTALHNLCFFIIIVLLCTILYFTISNHNNAVKPQNIGSLKHYDSIYNKRESHISFNQQGNITGYNSPNGKHYTFETPISPDEFFKK